MFNLVYAITLTMVKKYITYTKKDHEITRRAFLTILKMKPRTKAKKQSQYLTVSYKIKKIIFLNRAVRIGIKLSQLSNPLKLYNHTFFIRYFLFI